VKLSYGTRGGHPLSSDALAQWLVSPRGQRLIDIEVRELRRVLPGMFGRSLLQIGSWGQGDQLIANSEMLHHAVVSTVGSSGNHGAQTVAEPDALPILDKSIDAALLPHTLEFAHSPHDVLREVDRILTDRGRLMILGFNPWSFWGIRQLLGWRYRAFPGGARFHSASRLCDWLELLGYEVTQVRRYGVGFPWWGDGISVGEPQSLRSLLGPLMEAYLVVAKKRVIPLTVMRTPRRAQVRPMIGAVSLPGARAVEANQVMHQVLPPTE
jgi:SAM-dependent methyltransferase